MSTLYYKTSAQPDIQGSALNTAVKLSYPLSHNVNNSKSFLRDVIDSKYIDWKSTLHYLPFIVSCNYFQMNTTFVHAKEYAEFITVTCLDWQPLLVTLQSKSKLIATWLKAMGKRIVR